MLALPTLASFTFLFHGKGLLGHEMMCIHLDYRGSCTTWQFATGCWIHRYKFNFRNKEQKLLEPGFKTSPPKQALPTCFGIF